MQKLINKLCICVKSTLQLLETKPNCPLANNTVRLIFRIKSLSQDRVLLWVFRYGIKVGS
jgi:hypothetical protein